MATATHDLRLTLAVSLAVAGLLLPGHAAAQDDTTVFSTSVPPNVVLLVDTSGSMREILYPPSYDPAQSTCAIFDRIAPNDPSPSPESGTGDKNGTPYNCDANTNHCRFELNDGVSGYATSSQTIQCPDGSVENVGYIERTFCSNTRRLYVDPCQPDDTWYSEWFVEWYFSDAADTYVLGNETNTSTDATKIDANDNGVDTYYGTTYPLYKRSRIVAAQQIVRDVVYQTNSSCGFGQGASCTNFSDEVRFGLARFNGSEGSYVSADVDDYSVNKVALETAIYGLRADSSTPLAEALFDVYTFFMSRTTSERPFGQDTVSPVRFPEYSYDRSDGDFTSTSSDVAPDPIACPDGSTTCPCQKHFVLLISDGDPFNDDFSDTSAEAQGYSDFDALIGDYNPDSEVETGYLNNGTRYTDDVARFMSTVDFRPEDADQAGVQTIDVYTVGFNLADGSLGKALLEKTAQQGNGRSYFATQSQELTDALLTALSNIIEESQSFTAASVPASRATDGNNFFASYFVPSNTSPYWEGHLKLFEFNALGEVRDAPVPPATQGDCALDDPLAPARCRVGRLKIELDGFWDAADEIPPAASRALHVSRYAGSRPATIPSTPANFDVTLTTGDLDFAGLGLGIANLSDFSVAGPTAGITTDAELKDAIVRYVRGCLFQSGPCVDRGDGEKLWDIFHSNPVVVGPPNAGLSEVSYREFVSRYQNRKRVIYAGSNGGFVHGFNAGEYGTSAVPNGYDRGTGEEEFGFMAWPARKRIAELPRSTSQKQYYMDGAATAADVWLYPSPGVDPDQIAVGAWNRWRTVLVGGMRQGGRVYWALDVTNPPDHNSASGEQATGPNYPAYMWEFPCESADPACTGAGAVPTGRSLAEYMGETWGEPIVTRVRMEHCSPACATRDRWVAIVSAGYDPGGDPNLPNNASTAAGSRATDTAAADYDASDDAGTSRAGRAVFMIDITSGEVIAMRRYDHNATEGDPDMKYAFVASPAVFDLNFDGYADVAYFGDLGGNLWKWVISDVVPDAVNGSGDVEQRFDGTDGWKFLKVFSADPCVSPDCTGFSGTPLPRYKSFFFPPQGALVGATLWLAGGTGERADLDFVGTIPEERNRYYVFKDVDPLEREVPLPSAGTSRFTDADFVDATTLSGNCTPPPVGFYLEGVDGEKFITETEIFFGTVVTGSFVPDATAGSCDAAGAAYLYAFDLFCGDGALPPSTPSGSPRRHMQVGEGLPNRPRVSVGPVDGGGGGGGGCADMVVVITSEGEAFSDCPGGRPNSGVSLESWRDRSDAP